MKLDLKSNNLKLFILRFLIVSIPSFLIAFLFEKITLVVPTIAMFIIIANSIETGSNTNRNRIDDDISYTNNAQDWVDGSDGVVDARMVDWIYEWIFATTPFSLNTNSNESFSCRYLIN